MQLRAQLLARQRRKQRQQQQQQQQARPPQAQPNAFAASEDRTHVASAADLNLAPSPTNNPFAEDEDEATQIKSGQEIGQMFVNRRAKPRPQQPASPQPHQQSANPRTAFSIPEKTEVKSEPPADMMQAMRERQSSRRGRQAQPQPTQPNPARSSGNYNQVGRSPNVSGAYPNVSGAPPHAQRPGAAPINHTSAQPAVNANQRPHHVSGAHPSIQRPMHASGIDQRVPNVSGQFPHVGADDQGPTQEHNKLVLAPEEAAGLDEPTAASINVPQHATGFFPNVNKPAPATTSSAAAPVTSTAPAASATPAAEQDANLPEVSDPQRAASWAAAAVGLDEAFSTPLDDSDLDSPLHTRKIKEEIIVLNRRWPKDGEVPTPMRISYGAWGGAFGGMIAIALCVLLALVQGAAISSMFQMLVGLTVMAAGAIGAGCAAVPRKVEGLLLKTGMLPDDP